MPPLFIRGPVTESPPLAGGIVVFNVLQMLSLFFIIAALVPAAFSASIPRMKTWFALLITCGIYCVSYLLLLGHQNGPEPQLPICTLQAGLIYAGPPLVACAGLLFVTELYMRLSAVILSRNVNENIIYWMLWILPVVHTVDFWVAIMHGLADTRTISRDPSGLYCHITLGTPTTLTGALVGTFVGLMILGEIGTIIHLFRRRLSIKRIRIRGTDFPLPLFLRTTMYTLVGGIGIAMVDILVNKTKSSESSSSYVTLNLLAIVPLSVSLVFGTQMDIIKWYMFWRKETPWVHPSERSANA